jgi:hypothetical protein
MKAYLSTHLLIALNAVVIALVISGASWYAHKTKENTLTLLEKNITLHEQNIIELAELTDSNGADTLTAAVISDCPRRTEFENQLASLGTATKKELIGIQQLFESCGPFYAERKALMVSRLEQVYTSLIQDLEILETIRDLDETEKALYRWNELIEFEKTRSSLLSEQTDIQEEIISLLLQGTDTRTRITELVQQAQGVNQSLEVTNVQIDELRSSLIL